MSFFSQQKIFDVRTQITIRHSRSLFCSYTDHLTRLIHGQYTTAIFCRLDWFQPFCRGYAETGQVAKTSAGCQIALVFFPHTSTKYCYNMTVYKNTMPCRVVPEQVRHYIVTPDREMFISTIDVNLYFFFIVPT